MTENNYGLVLKRNECFPIPKKDGLQKKKTPTVPFFSFSLVLSLSLSKREPNDESI